MYVWYYITKLHIISDSLLEFYQQHHGYLIFLRNIRCFVCGPIYFFIHERRTRATNCLTTTTTAKTSNYRRKILLSHPSYHLMCVPLSMWTNSNEVHYTGTIFNELIIVIPTWVFNKWHYNGHVDPTTYLPATVGSFKSYFRAIG